MKRIFIAAVLIAGALSSCSKNEVTTIYEVSDDVNTIGLDVAASVTRANDTSATSLEDNAALTLYFYDSTGTTAQSGSIGFTYADGEWSQGSVSGINSDVTGAAWDDIVLPANFYSMHMGNDTTGDNTATEGAVAMTVNTTDGATATAAFAQTSADVSEHVDLVYFGNTLSAIPSAGKIRGTFSHALSRGELSIKAATGNKVYVAQCAVNAFGTSATATVTAATGAISWGTSSWSGTTSYNSAYSIFASNTTTAEQELENGEYIQSGTSTSSADGQFMMIPQATTALTADGSSGKYTLNTTTPEHHIEVLYRMEDAGGVSIVGYADAEDCANWSTTATYDSDSNGTLNSDSYVANDAALYVKVIFPFTSAVTFSAGTAYSIVLNFEDLGGYVADEFYYTEDEEITDIPITEDIEIGESVLVSDDTVIGIYVEEQAWGSASTTL